MRQIKIENGIITKHAFFTELKEGFIQADNFNGFVGDNASFYDDNWQRYPESYLYEKGLKEPPTGYLYDIDKKDIRQMTEVERIENGLDKLPKGFKIVNGELVQKSMQEQFKDKDITADEYASYQRGIRDSYLFATDKYMIVDFPVDEKSKQIIKDYRQYLRDLPKDPKFPDIEIKTPPLK